MFRGASSINLDTKGRIAIPTRYRDMLNVDCSGQLVCTIDIHQPCLLLYPLTEWEEIEHKLRGLSSMHAGERRLQRLLLGYANECDMDKNGRVLIAPTLRNHADLDKHIMLVGQLNRFEIWDQQAWEEQVKADKEIEQQGGTELSDRLLDFSL